MPDDRKRKHAPSFRGASAVQRVLASAGMRATKVELYQGHLGSIWEVETDRGKRWVNHSNMTGWRISRTPPAPATEVTGC